MEDQSGNRPASCKEDVRPMLAIEIDRLNSKIVDIREYLLQIQDLTSTTNTKIYSISNLEGLPPDNEKPTPKDNSKPTCALEHLANKINELDQLVDIAQNIIERQSSIYKNISQIG